MWTDSICLLRQDVLTQGREGSVGVGFFDALCL